MVMIMVSRNVNLPSSSSLFLPVLPPRSLPYPFPSTLLACSPTRLTSLPIYSLMKYAVTFSTEGTYCLSTLFWNPTLHLRSTCLSNSLSLSTLWAGLSSKLGTRVQSLKEWGPSELCQISSTVCNCILEVLALNKTEFWGFAGKQVELVS